MLSIKLTPKQRRTAGTWGARLLGVCLAAIPVWLTVLFFDNDPSTPNGNHAVYMTGLLVVIHYLLRFSIDLWKSGQERVRPAKRPLSPFLVSRIKAITIQSRIDLARYRRFVFAETYSSADTIFLHILDVSLIIFLQYSGIGGGWMLYIIGIFLLYLPYFKYRLAGERYRANKSLHEKVVYQFTAEGFTATGESFTTTTPWTALEKITERKHWLLFYLPNQQTIIIPKKAFRSFVAMAIIRQMRHHLNQ